ncbi:MAG: hypothetical protein KZQ58_07935 [gamma proteobacterium symbiont of Bathyaustriella thionipta]|nr:hypothetical protein [gamma proteobacterium symbiont of Bathyaustriella thionipta]
MRALSEWLGDKITSWLVSETPPPATPLCDFDRLGYELRPGDVVLIEGRSRIAEVIKQITQSNWTHAALYIGRLYDLNDREMRHNIQQHYQGKPNDQLLLEAELGTGTRIAPLNKYREHHVRICRPHGMTPDDATRVAAYALQHLGSDYDVRHIFDLGRFLFPWSFMPRRWRSSLFQHNAGSHTRTVCSCLIAQAFNSIDYPILPFIDRADDGSLRFYKRNPRLFTPRDFDYSPYFEIIKYPFLGLDDIGLYRRMPWHESGTLHNDELPASTPIEEPVHTQADDEDPQTANKKQTPPQEVVHRILARLGVTFSDKGTTS